SDLPQPRFVSWIDMFAACRLSTQDCSADPVRMSSVNIRGVAITGMPGDRMCAITVMPTISAADMIAIDGTESGAVPPEEGSEQACSGMPYSPALMMTCVSMYLNSSAVTEQLMHHVIGLAHSSGK